MTSDSPQKRGEIIFLNPDARTVCSALKTDRPESTEGLCSTGILLWTASRLHR